MIEMDMANSDEGYLKHSNEVEHSSLCLGSIFLANIR